MIRWSLLQIFVNPSAQERERILLWKWIASTHTWQMSSLLSGRARSVVDPRAADEAWKDPPSTACVRHTRGPYWLGPPVGGAKESSDRHPTTIYWRSREPFRIQKLIDHRTSRIAYFFFARIVLHTFISIPRNVKKIRKRRRRRKKNASALGCPGDDRRSAGFN